MKRAGIIILAFNRAIARWRSRVELCRCLCWIESRGFERVGFEADIKLMADVVGLSS